MIAVCITVVGKITEVKGKKGIAEVEGKKREMDLSLVKVKKGDYISCALNVAVEKLDAEEAEEILKARANLIGKKLEKE